MPQKTGVSACAPGGRSRKNERYSEEYIQWALFLCSKHNPSQISVNKAAISCNVPSSTLHDRIKGAQSLKVAHEDEQLLTEKQEQLLAIFIKMRGWRGEGMDLDDVWGLASEICGHPVEIKWPYNFHQHHPELAFRWAKRGEAKRASGANKTNVDSFFDVLQQALEDPDLHPADIWNVDEKGITMDGGVLQQHVLVDSDQAEPKLYGDENRKMVTIIECISATGGLIPPLIIHEGAEKDGEWVRNNPCGAE